MNTLEATPSSVEFTVRERGGSAEGHAGGAELAVVKATEATPTVRSWPPTELAHQPLAIVSAFPAQA